MEGVIAVSAGAIASSVALIEFAVDSVVETASGAVVGWRLRGELNGQADEEWVEDLLAALAMIPLVVREGFDGLRGDDSN